jgi:hypothetical protein
MSGSPVTHRGPMIQHLIRQGSWVVALAIGVPLVARAQMLSPRTIEQINTAAKVRVHLRDGRQGTLHGPEADSTALTYRRSHFLGRGGIWFEMRGPLAVQDVERIEVPVGSRAASGAKIGAAAMAALTLVAIAGCAGSICEPSSGDAVVALVFWPAIGAGVGALIGSGSTRWKTVYPASAR